MHRIILKAILKCTKYRPNLRKLLLIERVNGKRCVGATWLSVRDWRIGPRQQLIDMRGRMAIGDAFQPHDHAPTLDKKLRMFLHLHGGESPLQLRLPMRAPLVCPASADSAAMTASRP